MRVLRGQDLTIHVCQDPWVGGLTGRAPLFRAMAKTGTIRTSAVLGDAIGRMVTERAAAAGIPAGNITGHSLRSGFVTQAIRAGDGSSDHASDRTQKPRHRACLCAGECAVGAERRQHPRPLTGHCA